MGLQVTRIVLAGNNHGNEIENWRGALATELPDIEPLVLQVSSRKQSADAALIMEIGANLELRLRYRERIIIVSCDHFLVGAAERAKTKGSWSSSRTLTFVELRRPRRVDRQI